MTKTNQIVKHQLDMVDLRVDTVGRLLELRWTPDVDNTHDRLTHIAVLMTLSRLNYHRSRKLDCVANV